MLYVTKKLESFEELYSYNFTHEKSKSLNYDNYFNQISPENSFENMDSIILKENYNEIEVFHPKKIEEKIIKQSDINDILILNKNQNNFKRPQNLIIKNSNETIDTTNKNENLKKKGRKNKGNTEERRHNSESLDNLRDKSGTSFMRNILTVLNNLCIKHNLHLKKVNFKKQFGTNCILNARFIQAKLYKIFSFDSPQNEKVIQKMIEKNDIIFNYLMKSTFEFMYLKYINDDHRIFIDGIDYLLPSFITLSEEVEKRKESIKSEVNEQSQIEEEYRKLLFFEEQSKNLIKNLKGEGKLKKRNIIQSNSIICKYITIPEYD